MKKEKIIKINEIVNEINDRKIPLPIITNCSEGTKYENEENIEEQNYLQSSFYQTTKMICYSFHKPLYLSRSNDK